MVLVVACLLMTLLVVQPTNTRPTVPSGPVFGRPALFHVTDPVWTDRETLQYKVFEAPVSRRKFIASVATMPHNGGPDRLTAFHAAWTEAWPGLHVRRQVNFRNAIGIKGFGVLAGVWQSLMEAMLSGLEYDYLLLFEDDALPFANTEWPSHPNSVFETHLGELERRNGTMLQIGGHCFKWKSRNDHPMPYIAHAWFGWGAYAVVIPRKVVPLLESKLFGVLETKSKSENPVDEYLWTFVEEITRTHKDTSGGYIAVPRLVDHRAPGYVSSTHQVALRYDFEGHPDLWNDWECPSNQKDVNPRPTSYKRSFHAYETLKEGGERVLGDLKVEYFGDKWHLKPSNRKRNINIG